MNMDAQDKQDESLMRRKPDRAIIGWGFSDAQHYKRAVPGKILCILCIDVNYSFK
jgi:hypothetical protein